MSQVNYVLCFDRDETVDVNNGPVPLQWVKHFAHERDDIDCWAIGNQHLKKEAAIYGIEEARELWESKHERSVKGVYTSSGYYNYKPSRADGLRLIADLYRPLEADAPELTVIDDTNTEPVFHLYPREFVGFIEDGYWDFDEDDINVCDRPANSNDCTDDLEASVSIE